MECLATWKDGSETYLYARLTGAQLRSKNERFRCFVSCPLTVTAYNKDVYSPLRQKPNTNASTNTE